ncbi:MAG: DUF456 domain-containing protein [Phycisphaerales bacterium]|nr:DUF456 domain-containing protein [Phycisphaerales bacterium]
MTDTRPSPSQTKGPPLQFVFGLVIGLIIGLFAGAILPEMFKGPAVQQTDPAITSPRSHTEDERLRDLEQPIDEPVEDAAEVLDDAADEAADELNDVQLPDETPAELPTDEPAGG